MADPINKIVLLANNFEELKKIPFLKEILQLCYIINTLRSSQRFLLQTNKYYESPIRNRDTLFGLLITVSFLYEGTETASRILRKLVSSLPNEIHNDITWVIKQKNEHDSFFNNTLFKIRTIVFHFGLKIEDTELKNSIAQYPPIFAEGSSTITVDMSFSLADNVITRILSAYVQSTDTPEEKVIDLVKQLSQYNEKLCRVIDNVIGSLICNYAEA
ncbi:MAG: hypothetical protein EPO24_06905 [Bacteroidetes bacterium]|nr:MAG: hypothetical protein EPO24_06905 [Bacteroidota bacterium]